MSDTGCNRWSKNIILFIKKLSNSRHFTCKLQELKNDCLIIKAGTVGSNMLTTTEDPAPESNKNTNILFRLLLYKRRNDTTRPSVNFNMLRHFEQCSILFPLLQYLHLPNKVYISSIKSARLAAFRDQVTFHRTRL